MWISGNFPHSSSVPCIGLAPLTSLRFKERAYEISAFVSKPVGLGESLTSKLQEEFKQKSDWQIPICQLAPQCPTRSQRGGGSHLWGALGKTGVLQERGPRMAAAALRAWLQEAPLGDSNRAVRSCLLMSRIQISETPWEKSATV